MTSVHALLGDTGADRRARAREGVALSVPRQLQPCTWSVFAMAMLPGALTRPLISCDAESRNKCCSTRTAPVAIAVADAIVIVVLFSTLGRGNGGVAWAVYPLVLNRICEVAAHCFLPGTRHDSVRVRV